MRTVKELVERYELKRCGEGFVVNNAYRMRKDNAVAELKARKTEIVNALIEAEEAEKKAREEREQKIAGIEGLTEIKDAQRDIEKWHDEFSRSFGRVGGMGVRQEPQYDLKAMRAKYPRADAYLKAEAEANKINYELSAIGRNALEKIINEPDGYESAIAEMEKALNEYANRYAFD